MDYLWIAIGSIVTPPDLETLPWLTLGKCETGPQEQLLLLLLPLLLLPLQILFHEAEASIRKAII